MHDLLRPAPILALSLVAVPALAQGTPRFPTRLHDCASFPRSPVVAELDGDGHLDLVVTDGGADAVLVLFGNGAGGFDGSVELAVSLNPVQVQVADVDGAGGLDLVVTDDQLGDFRVFLGGGDGSFAALPPVPMPDDQDFARTGDVDGDGDLDIVSKGRNTADFTVLAGDGAGGFSTLSSFELPFPGEFVLAELTGDGALDIALLVFPPAIQLFPGDGAGGFTEGPVVPISAQYPHLSAADVDGNGRLDLLAAGGFHDGVDVLRFPVGPGLPSLLHVDGPPIHSPAAVDDLDGDGHLDIAGPTTLDGTATVWLADGLGGFGAPSSFFALPLPNGFALGDFTEDGFPDAIETETQGFQFNVALLEGDGSGGFVEPSRIDGVSDPGRIELADMNGDGRLDLVVHERGLGAVGVRFGNGFGELFPGPSVPTGGVLPTLAVADADGDADLDLALLELFPFGPKSLSVYRNDGTGHFGAAVVSPLPAASMGASVGDVDGDGQLDLASTDGASIEIWLGSLGQLALAPLVVPAPAGALVNGQSTKLADLNGDGRDDLLFLSGAFTSTRVTAMIGDGLGGFTEGGSATLTILLSEILVEDFDENGTADVILTGSGAAFIAGDGLGGLGSPVSLGIPGAGTIAEVADVDLDGHLDIVTGSMWVALGDGAGDFPRLEAYATFADPQGAAVGDLNGDLRQDVVTSHGALDALGVFLNRTPCGGSVSVLGAGCTGLGGFAPALSLEGCPTPGALLRLRLTGGPGGAPALVLAGGALSATPLPGGCELQLDPVFPVAVSLDLGGTGPGAGEGVFEFELASTTATGLAFAIQAFVVDPSVPALFTATNGLLVDIQ